ncbi:hypothetical protein K1719_030830 [Acacia pycnantha]|nr:hypothetical protein K1719_030830 [Acacia pycnantha]
MRSRRLSSTMMKNKRVEDDIPFLPEGIIRDILIRLPGHKKIRKDHGEHHWEDFDVVIFSFDLATEVWTVIPMPEHHFSTVSQNLMVYERKLAFVFCKHSAIHLWVREEGVGASGETWNWTKKFTSNPYPYSGLVPIPKTMWGNEIFCRIWDSKSTNTVLFNPTTEKFKKLKISKCDDQHQIFNFVESLVSVGGTKSSTKFLKRQGPSSRGLSSGVWTMI